MSDRIYSPQEVLEMMYRDGQYRRQLGREPEPLLRVVHCATYYTTYPSESFLQQAVEWYQAGYNGLTLAPAQWQ